MSSESDSIRRFIEEILETSISDARVWVKAYRSGVPASMWASFLDRPITAEAVERIAEGISLQISRAVGQMTRDAGSEKLTEGHRFLKEIYQKARDHSIDVDVKKIDWIRLPGLERVKEILARTDL
ncbi:MAG: hypothetical protein NTW46_02210 [Candidatus Nealsonbacteria bacterium]|nr:hypothetical protein [Candidatus Nealsonbacteria bacterium]